MADIDAIVQDEAGLFGFRLELGRDRNGTRMQARRGGFATEKVALAEYQRLCRQRDARQARSRLSDTVQTVCQTWLHAREHELQPNTLYCYNWLLGLVYPYVGRVRASRLSTRMVEHAYRQLEAAGYSRTSLRTLDLVLSKAIGEQTGRTLGTRKPRQPDDVHAVWTLAEARRFLDHVGGDRLYPTWRLLLITGLRRGELCGLQWSDLEPDLASLHVCRQRGRGSREPDPGEAAEIPQWHPNLAPGPGDPQGSHRRARESDNGGLDLHVRRAYWPALAARQHHQPVQPARPGRRCPPDRTPPDPAPARLDPARQRVRHPRGRRTSRPRSRHPHALLRPS
jgi:integrase